MKSMAKEEVGMCECGWCGSAGHTMRGHFTHRLIVLIIAVVVAFWVGFKLGEIQGFLESITGNMFSHHNWGMYDDRDMHYFMHPEPAVSTPAITPTTPASPTPSSSGSTATPKQ